MIQGLKNKCCSALRVHVQHQSRYSSLCAKDEWRARRSRIFDDEFEKQKSDVGRIEKIQIKYIQLDGNEVQLSMNKNLSTPSDCTLHISEYVNKTGALALVDDEPWDMHKPLVNDCKLQVLTMRMPKMSVALNYAFWRTCSLILGATIDSSFKDDISVFLYSFTWPNVKSGSFVCDAVLDLPDWKPTDAELRALSAQFVKFTTAALPVKRLQVSEKIALDMFKDNPFKTEQIPNIARLQDGKVTVYRMGEHIDISKGPMIGNTSIVGKVTVSAVHKIKPDEIENLYRFQGVALPHGVFLNHFAYGLLESRAKHLNKTGLLPFKQHNELEQESPSLEKIAHS